ncbi:MAG: hypothetical protein AAGI23_15290 [Bacteroidota bacterium]
MMELAIDILGWIGSILLVAAYWMVSRGRIDPKSATYHGMNIIASILLTINTVYYGALPSATVNTIWIFIGSYYVYLFYKNRKVSA